MYSELLPFVQEDPINENCNLSKVLSHNVVELAIHLLAIYGNAVRTSLSQDYKLFLDSPEFGLGVNDPDLMTIRFKSLHVYLQRIVRPIWEMKLTFR